MLSSEEEEKGPVCRLSHPAQPHTLSRLTEGKPWAICFAGAGIDDKEKLIAGDYYCTKCDVDFQEYCHNKPRKMTHPYHPQHPLISSDRPYETREVYDIHSHLPFYGPFEGVVIPDSGNLFDNCTWCGGSTIDSFSTNFYRCSTCNFCLCTECSKTFPPPTIQNPKSHHHSLIFLPRPLLLPCDTCGLVERSEPSYACFQCNFVVHRSCIDFPRVLKLTRHPHRLFYTPFRSPTISPCRICYKTVDVKYGHYSCNHDDCSYVVHSKCATHKQIWDGRELEWEPEESGEAEDVAPFNKVGDGVIKYFCHDHHLKLDKYDGLRDKNKQCQACILHIDSRDFYNCVECDFFLHEVCANLPRKLDHALHNHPLFLDPYRSDSSECYACSRPSAGFRYKCSKDDCEVLPETRRRVDKNFQVDVGCILVSDCFTHKSHEHPLFIPIQFESGWCEGCQTGRDSAYLQCTTCKYGMCYTCATMPEKLYYKYDALPLSLCYGEVSLQAYWCEVCEKKLDPSEWFYTCSKSSITIHSQCVFGGFAYMKPGYTFNRNSFSVEVICNDSNTRPFCQECNRRCSRSVYFKWSDGMVTCSHSCFSYVLWIR